MLEESFSTAEVDMRARALREAQVEARRLVEATDAALAADAELLDDSERAELDTLLTALRNIAQSDDADAIETATKSLAEGTDEFAARRMNKGIRRALAGRKLDEI
jgi:molecular chaperone HscA